MPTEPAFMGKFRPVRRGELLALNDQGHYLRVMTRRGEDLVLHLFGDALAELPVEAGLRVHRSWWISNEAIAACTSASARQICLDTGLTVPVSRTYQRELEARLPT